MWKLQLQRVLEGVYMYKRGLVVNFLHLCVQGSSQSGWWALLPQLPPSPVARTALGVTLTVSAPLGFVPEDFKEAELPEESTARCGTLAALCTGVRKAVFTCWNSWSLIIYFSWHVEALLSNETPLCAKCSRHRRGNIISMKRLYPGKAGHKHINRERTCQWLYFKKLNKQTTHSWIAVITFSHSLEMR